MRNHFLICSCSSSEHTLRFIYDKSENEIYTEVYLNQHKNLFKRLIVAIKYIFGYTSKYGHFDCTMMDESEAKKLYHWLKHYIKC
jgi:hypothetical protein